MKTNTVKVDINFLWCGGSDLGKIFKSKDKRVVAEVDPVVYGCSELEFIYKRGELTIQGHNPDTHPVWFFGTVKSMSQELIQWVKNKKQFYKASVEKQPEVKRPPDLDFAIAAVAVASVIERQSPYIKTFNLQSNDNHWSLGITLTNGNQHKLRAWVDHAHGGVLVGFVHEWYSELGGHEERHVCDAYDLTQLIINQIRARG